jgi:hypothetical protein
MNCSEGVPMTKPSVQARPSTSRAAEPIVFRPEIEHEEVNESVADKDLEATLKGIRESAYKESGHARRSLHAKSHGISSGPIGAILVGVIASIVTLVIGQMAFSMSRSLVLRAMVALLFSIPAALAGYHAALGLALIALPAEGWRHALAVAAAIIVAGTAWARMTLSGPPDARQGVAAGPTSPPPPASQTAAG